MAKPLPRVEMLAGKASCGAIRTRDKQKGRKKEGAAAEQQQGTGQGALKGAALATCFLLATCLAYSSLKMDAVCSFKMLVTI
jgi:hypothetical protein